MAQQDTNTRARLLGKVILITGAAQGIGKATAKMCATEGAKVIATDMNSSLLEELKGEDPRIVTELLDVTNGDQIKEVVTKHQDINVVFNCAGWVHHGRVDSTSEQDWDRSFSINVKSMFLLSKAAVQLWKENKVAGNIINMASVASSIKGAEFRCAYGASKAAVIGLTKSIAADYVKDGIRCNAICPGTVDSPSLQDRMKAQGDYDTARKVFIERQKMGRLGKTEEVAYLFVYLASDESAFVTGTDIVIDGGWSI
ncbi:hypothetical protein EMCRGX_G029232 [Ephydatia muelleri]